MLTKETVLPYLHTKGLSLTVKESVSSTNRLLKELAQQGAPEGSVMIASSQTEGRGRLGRTFFSPEGTGLYMSVLLRPCISPGEALSITTAAAVAVCRAIERVSSRVARIKWVNDIFCDDKKVCGILTEAAIEPETGGLSYAVLGIGVNAFDPAGGFPEELRDIAASVFGVEKGNIAPLAAAILDEFFAEYAVLAEGRFIGEYRSRSLLCGRRVVVKAPTGDREATAVEVDEQCRLRVRYDDGREELLSSGEVSIRL